MISLLLPYKRLIAGVVAILALWAAFQLYVASERREAVEAVKTEISDAAREAREGNKIEAEKIESEVKDETDNNLLDSLLGRVRGNSDSGGD